MKIIPRLLLNRKTFAAFDEFVATIIAMLTGNINFPITEPGLPVVQAKSDEYHNAVVAAENGNKQQRQVRNQKRSELHIMVTDLAWDVASRSAGDLAIYLTSGFDYKRPRVPAGELTAPGNNRLAYNQNSGELVNRHNQVKGAILYVIMVGTTPVPTDTPVSSFMASGPTAGPDPGQDWWWAGVSSATTYTIKDLTPGIMYYTRCLAIGSGGSKVGPWSTVVGKMAI